LGTRLANFDHEAKGMLGMLGMLEVQLGSDNSQARDLFDWTPITFKQSVLETSAAVKAIQDNR